jgi:hypothetical protein
MSDGLYKSLEEATRTDQVNKDLAQMAVEQVGTEIHKFMLLMCILCNSCIIWLMLMFIYADSLF